MQIWEFIRELAFYFPLSRGSEAEKNKIFDSYVENLEGICVKNRCEYDWKKVLHAIQQTYSYNKFPALADIIKCMPEGKIVKPYEACEGEGSLLVVTLPDGRIYDFTVSAIGRPLDFIRKEMEDKHGKGLDIKIYPVGTVRIGKKIFLP